MKQDETCPILRCSGPSSYNSNISNILWDYLILLGCSYSGYLGASSKSLAPKFSPQGHQLGLLRWRPDVDQVRRLFGHEAGEVEEVGVHSRGFGLVIGHQRKGVSRSFQKFPSFPHVFPNWKGYMSCVPSCCAAAPALPLGACAGLAFAHGAKVFLGSLDLRIASQTFGR